MAVAAAQDPIETLLADFRQARPLRTGSLIITIFGDVIAPRGGQVTLASLLPLLYRFGVNDSQARTAMSRLVADGWLVRVGEGRRRGLYGVPRADRDRFAEAERKIYQDPPNDWDGRWHLVVGSVGPAADSLRKELEWLGFGSLAADAFIHPNPDGEALRAVLGRCPPEARPIVIDGTDIGGAAPAVLHAIARSCWKLDRLTAAHERFLSQFGPLDTALVDGWEPNAEAACIGVILLVHAFRRVVLRDPQLPGDLLAMIGPAGGPGPALAGFTRRLAPMAYPWIREALDCGDGMMPGPDRAFAQRFNGTAGL